jgi:PIN domain nuclease of toxin-antitoxin system
MRLLLDTHTFLWFIDGSPDLSSYIRGLIEEPSNERLLSIASLWEMAIKISMDRLELNMTFTDLVENQVKANAIELLPIKPGHLDVLANLPFHHRDPFDRLLIAQSISEGIPILSRDGSFDDYSIKRLW